MSMLRRRMVRRAKRRTGSRSNLERRTSTQERLLEATLALLVERGYAATSTNAVVKRARISRGGLVHHYSSKADLVAAAAVHLIRKRYAREEASVVGAGAHPTIRERLERVRREYEDWFPATLEFMVACRTDRALADAFSSAMAPYAKSLTEFKVAAWPEFSHRASPALIQYAIGCFIRGLSLEAIVNSKDLTDEIFQEFVRMVEVYAAEGPTKARKSGHRRGS
jgi:AcrR family transcriptional regulator